MSSDTAGKIFDPSFSTKDGIGIGLANVKDIMKQHKANILADSLPDVGTSISILFNSIPEEEVHKLAKQRGNSVQGDR